MSEAVSLFAGPYALSAAGEALEEDFLVASQFKSKIEQNAKQCLEGKFAQVQSLEALPALVASMGADCNKEVQ